MYAHLERNWNKGFELHVTNFWEPILWLFDRNLLCVKGNRFKLACSSGKTCILRSTSKIIKNYQYLNGCVCDNGQRTVNHLCSFFSSSLWPFFDLKQFYLGLFWVFRRLSHITTKTKINYKEKPKNEIIFIDILIIDVTTGATTISNG